MDSASVSVQSSSGGAGDDEHDSVPVSTVLEPPAGFDTGELFMNYNPPKFNPTSLPNFTSFLSDPLLGSNAAWLHGATQPLRSINQIRPPPSPQPPPPPPATAEVAAATSVGKARLEQQPGSTRPKKRPRASRRAPTTVLTTDTSNFRQMVQEFTGVPAHPFSAFARPRIDYFGPGAAAAAQSAATLEEPKFLLRPFPQKEVPATTLFGPLLSGSLPTAPVGVISTSRPPSSDSLPQSLFAFESLPLPIVGPAVSSLAPAGGPSDAQTSTGGLSSFFAAATSTGGGGLEHVWLDDRPPELPTESGGGGSRGGGSIDSWLCSSD